MRVTFSLATEMTNLLSNHEEANTNVTLHCVNALSASKDSALILCSLSGDTDVNVLATVLLQNYKSRLLIEFYGSGSSKKIFCWLKDFILNEASDSALLRLHAFTNVDNVLNTVNIFELT